MQIGGERFFEEPFIKYFKKFLDLETKVQLIVDTEDHMDIAKALKKAYGENLDIRFMPGPKRERVWPAGLCRSVRPPGWRQHFRLFE